MGEFTRHEGTGAAGETLSFCVYQRWKMVAAALRSPDMKKWLV